MLDFLEMEETVGRAWHRLVGGAASYPINPDHAVSLAEMQSQIAVMFRAFGGEPGVAIAGSNTRKSGHRLGWRQRIGLGNESLDQSGRDPATVFLPVRIAIFPDRDMNASLYRWLAAWFATVTVTTVEDHDPLRRDLLVLRRARETVAAVLADSPDWSNPTRHCRLRRPPRDPSDHCPEPKRRWRGSCSPSWVPRRRPQETSGPR